MLTLAVLAVLSLIVIGFLVSMRTEQTAARNSVYVTVARQMAQSAVDDAVFLMRANMPLLSPTNSFATMAGAVVAWPTAPSVGGNLYSVSSAGTIDLNADQVIVSASNSFYSTLASRSNTVNWINVCSNGAPSGTALVGRFAFWVDDEAAKLNINSANQRDSTDIMGTTASAVDLTVLSGVGPATATSSWMFGQTNGYFTLEQWQKTAAGQIGSLNLSNQFFLTPFSIDSDQTPWGTKKFNLNTNGAAGFMTFTNEIDTGAVATLANPALANWFGQTFVGKYGGTVDIPKQILANIMDFRLATGGWATGAHPGYLNTGADFGLTQIPRYYLGLRRYPFINEITAQVVWWYPNGAGNLPMQAKLWIGCELVNPYPVACGSGGRLVVNVDKFRFNVVSTNAVPSFANFAFGPQGSVAVDPWQSWVPGAGAHSGFELTYDLGAFNMPANSYTNISIGFWIEPDGVAFPYDTSAVVTSAFVSIQKVRLLQTAGDDRTIRDWASRTDFTNSIAMPSTYGEPQLAFPDSLTKVRFTANANGTPPDWATAFTCGIAKNDPRVRTFTDYRPPTNAWYRVGFNDGSITVAANTTVGGENTGIVNFYSGTGLANIPNDPPPTVAPTVANHPSFYSKASATDTNYESIGELGYIHTGLQWRTLLLQPCSASEMNANLIPDWAVLDIFSITNAPMPGRININGIITNLASATTPRRVLPLQGLLTGITAGNGMGSSNDQARIASNIYNQVWAASSSWSTNRTIAPRTFKSGVFNMIGELCEIDLVCANWLPSTALTNKFAAENRIRSFANLVTTRSDTFSVWAVGQAIQDINSNGTFDSGDLITAETKVQAVVQRYEDNGQVKFRTLYFRYLTP
ncbi:MAG: hypothetical protein WCS70_14740 [Verrucomicrobiota bacterium]